MRPLLLLLMGAILAAPSASAQTLGPVQLHGFATWVSGQTDGNEYLVAKRQMAYKDGRFALNLGADLPARFRVAAQLYARVADETERQVDFAFGEWRLNEAFAIRAGRVKQPFGLYTEVFDVGTLRPFVELPQATYGSSGFVAEGYDGAGITGAFSLANLGKLGYDVYAGQLRREKSAMMMHVLDAGGAMADGSDEWEEVELVTQLVGGRLSFAPREFLSMSLSSYTARAAAGERLNTMGGSLDFSRGRWSGRSELFRRTEGGSEERETAFYGEGGIRLTTHWQAVTQYNQLDTEIADYPAAAPRSFLKHREGAVGVNYWVTPDAVLKASVHRINGNRLAMPAGEDAAASIADGSYALNTNLVMLGVSFSF